MQAEKLPSSQSLYFLGSGIEVNIESLTVEISDLGFMAFFGPNVLSLTETNFSFRAHFQTALLCTEGS